MSGVDIEKIYEIFVTYIDNNLKSVDVKKN